MRKALTMAVVAALFVFGCTTTEASQPTESVATNTPKPTATFTPVPTGTPERGDWGFEQDVDPLTDEVIAIAYLESESGRSRFDDAVTLILRCKGKAIDLYVEWHDFLNNEPVPVISRINDGTPQERTWGLSTDFTSTFYPEIGWQNIEAFIGGAARLVLQVEPYNESPVTAVFDMTGFDLAADQVLTACGI